MGQVRVQWLCQYHIDWVPKVLSGEIGIEVRNCIRAFSERKECQIVELNVEIDHVHLLVMIPPKISISDYMGMIKGSTAIGVLNKFKKMKQNSYWGNKFWARGYCVDTVGLDSEMIREYVKHQVQKEKRSEQPNLFS